jgi:hypothetical protein
VGAYGRYGPKFWVDLRHLLAMRVLQKMTFTRNFLCTPNGIRTRAATLKGWCPRPLDDGGLCFIHLVTAWWSGCRDLNPGPLRPERSALPSCATARGELPRSPPILLVE